MDSHSLRELAKQHIGQKKAVLLAAAELVDEQSAKEQQYRDVERALESLDWFDGLNLEWRAQIVGAVLFFKERIDAGEGPPPFAPPEMMVR
jgi:hypothetical protein